MSTMTNEGRQFLSGTVKAGTDLWRNGSEFATGLTQAGTDAAWKSASMGTETNAAFSQLPEGSTWLDTASSIALAHPVLTASALVATAGLVAFAVGGGKPNKGKGRVKSVR
jgi:hypothetical protein